MNGTHWRFKGEEEKAPIQYTGCGLDDIYLLSGYEYTETPYGRGLKVKNLEQLHRAIGMYLAAHKKALSGKELRFLRMQMDFTQSELGGMVGLSSQQVARWEKEQSDISGPAEALLRLLYLDHIGEKKLDVQGLLKAIEEMDTLPKEACYFKETPDGWKAQEAA
jgi:putative transcriptional regulator